MAFTRGPVANGDSTSSTDPLATSAFSLSAGKLLVVCVSWESTNGTPSVSDTAGNSFTPGTKVQCSGPNNKWVQMFYCLSTAANASNIVSVDLPGTSTADFAHVGASVYNPSGTATFVAEGTGSSNSATPTTSSFTAGDCAIGIMGEFCGQTGTAGSGWTIVADTPTNASHVVDRIDSPGGSITCTVNIAGCDSCIVAMSFADGGGGGGGTDPAPKYQDGLPGGYYADPGWAAIWGDQTGGITVANRSGAGVTVSSADGSITATNTTTGVGAATQKADASDTNVLTLTGVGAASQKSDASSTAVLTMTGVGAATQKADASSTAVLTLTGTGQAVTRADGSITAVDTTTGVGAATQGADASSTAVLSMTGVGAATQKSDASTSGVLTLAGVGASTGGAAGDGSITALNTTTGVGAATQKAAGFTLRTSDATLVLGLNLDGNFTDISAYGHVLTNNGVTTSSAQFKAGTASGLFTTTGTEIHAAATAEWAFGTANGTTWQAWVYPTTVDATRRSLWDWRFDGTGSGTTLSCDFTSSDIRFQVGIGSTLWTCQLGTGSLTANTWQHVRTSLDGPIMRLFVDGVQAATTTITSPGALNGSSGGSVPMWGRKNDSTQNFGGYMDLIQVHGSCLDPGATSFTPAASVLTPPAEFSGLFGVGSSQAPTVNAASGGITITATLTGTGAAKAGAAGSVGAVGNLYGDTGGAASADTGGGKKKRKSRRQLELERDEEELLEIAALIVPLLGSSTWVH